MTIQSIDFETHFYTKAAFDYLSKRKTYPKFIKLEKNDSYNLCFSEQILLFQNNEFIDILCNLGDKRISAMDEAGLDCQVLSFSSPGIDELSPDIHTAHTLSREINDLLFETIKKYPNRFRGFASIAPYQSQLAIQELERCIKELKFVGWLAHSNFGDNLYFDDKQFWPILEAAEALNIPIYIHPTSPLMPMFGTYGFSLGGPPLGFQVDVALCVLRMIYAGVFDQFPKLKIMIGHMGETLPFLMPDRIDWAYANPNISKLAGFIQERPKIKRTPSEVIAENAYITTSGRFSKPLLDYVIAVMGIDRVLLATDYPYENLKQSMDFIRNSGLSTESLNKILIKNARQLKIL